MGGKSIGMVWKGRACWATTSVARRVAGSGFSGVDKSTGCSSVGNVKLENRHTSPGFGVLQHALLGLFLGALSWHWHGGLLIKENTVICDTAVLRLDGMENTGKGRWVLGYAFNSSVA